MIKRQISFLEVSLYLSEISENFREAISEEFSRFGVEILNFYCESLEPNPESYEKLRHYKEELALGADFYQQRRSLDIMERLAANPSSGGIANAGIGIGMGLGAAGQMGNIFANLGNKNINDGQPEQSSVCPKCGAKNPPSMKFCGKCGERMIAEKICPHCGAKIPDNMKFCGECGKPLVVKCPACGYENKADMKFCGNCGQQL